MNEHGDDRLLTRAEICQKLYIGDKKLRDLIRDGTIPVIVVGRRMRFDWQEVLRSLRAQTVEYLKRPPLRE